MIYCINPKCKHRQNPDELKHCQFCGTQLLINGRFRLLEPLRSLDINSPTEVFEVVDEKGTCVDKPGTNKVMKVLNPTKPCLIELMQREANVLQYVGTRGIPLVDIDGYFTFQSKEDASELHCLVLEKIPGQNLQDWIELNGKISQSLALDWLKQLLGILDALHSAGFFHRDIKPSNIILRPDGTLALIDFGAVREVTHTYMAKVSRGLITTTEGGGFFDVTVVRSACYTPLEQLNGKAVPQSDFYALGHTFVYLLTGIPLGALPNDSETGRLIWRQKAPEVDKPFANLLDDMMSPFPGRRPQNTQIILQRLERLPLQLKLRQIARSTQFKAVATVLFVLASVGSVRGAQLIASWYYLQAGLYHQVAKELPEARQDYEQASQFDPNNTDTLNNLAQVCQGLGDIACAEASYKRLLSLNGKDWGGHYNLGSFYDEQGREQEAEREYQLAAQWGSDSIAVLALNNLSRLNDRKGGYAAAAKLARQGLGKTRDPLKQATLYKNLGWAALGQKQYENAKEYLQTALNLSPERTDAYCLLAQVQEVLNDWKDSKGAWEACLRADSNLPEVEKWREQMLKRLFKGKRL